MTEHRIVGGLQHSPVIAARLGVFVAEFVKIETALINALSCILKISFGVAEIILDAAGNIDDRWSITENSLKASDISDLKKEQFQSWLNTVKVIIAQRNKYINSVYMVNINTGEVFTYNHAHSVIKSKEINPVIIEMFDTDIENIRKCVIDLLEIFLP